MLTCYLPFYSKHPHEAVGIATCGLLYMQPDCESESTDFVKGLECCLVLKLNSSLCTLHSIVTSLVWQMLNIVQEL